MPRKLAPRRLKLRALERRVARLEKDLWDAMSLAEEDLEDLGSAMENLIEAMDEMSQQLAALSRLTLGSKTSRSKDSGE